MLKQKDRLLDLIKKEIRHQLDVNLPIGKVIETSRINHSGFSLQDVWDGLDYLQGKKLIKFYGMARERFMLTAGGVDWVTGDIKLPGELVKQSKIQIFWLNPWVVGIGATVIAGIILWLIFK